VSYTLLIANKAYSSWSFRPWILMRHFAIQFAEIVVPLGQASTHTDMLVHTPSAKAPCLKDGEITVWESLAIIEYLAENHSDLPIWPQAKAARAMARALAAEMHAGFMGLRAHLPMNMRRKISKRALTPDAEADVARLEIAFGAARGTYGQAGPFLFGDFSAADAMFAPIVNRLHIYDVAVSRETRAYMDTMMDLPAFRKWAEEAQAEPWRLEKYDAI
jgi:glutathione S-transferase